MAAYRCKRCNYMYIDKEKDISFETLNGEYRCPKCRAPKSFFLKKEIQR
jgi:rubredoxin